MPLANLDIARAVTEAVASQAPTTNNKGWRWRKGVVLFPEVKCPYCKGIVKSKALWLTTDTKLLGQGVPRHGEEFKLDKPYHPHALTGDGGTICFGDAYDAVQALFGGLNPDSTYTDCDEWLRSELWGHECEEMRQSDHDDEFMCERCNEYFHEDDSYNFADELYCSSCFYEIAFNCHNCCDNYSVDDRCEAFDRSYCRECFHQYFFECEGCNEVFERDAMCGGGECADCYEPPTTCEACGESYDEDDYEERSEHSHLKCTECEALYRGEHACGDTRECEYCADVLSHTSHDGHPPQTCDQCPGVVFGDPDCLRLHQRIHGETTA